MTHVQPYSLQTNEASTAWESASQIDLQITLSDKNSSDEIVEISTWCQKFCPTKNFVRRKFCLIFQYKIQAKIGQSYRNFGLVSKILSDEILSDKVILFYLKNDKIF